MAYHSEVLQKERDTLRRNRLSSPTSAELNKLQEEKGDSSGARRAGGGSHRFSVMAEAALAQVRKQRPLVHSAPRIGIVFVVRLMCCALPPPSRKELWFVYGMPQQLSC